MVYYVIGLMSGSSLDGLDIAYVQLEEVAGRWAHQILQAETMPYSEAWHKRLKDAPTATLPDFFKLHTAYGRLLGSCTQAFIEKHALLHKVHFIASHGHTLFHEPEHYTTVQIGDGAGIAAITSLPVITDLRNMDVALGGQGAPIVPLGDKLLFSQHPYLLNIGGIANITIQEKALAFDISVANQAFNYWASALGHPYDDKGIWAAQGNVIEPLVEPLLAQAYHLKTGSKSLSNAAAISLVEPLLQADASPQDKLATWVAVLAKLVAQSVERYPAVQDNKTLFVTGGGALNTFLMQQIQAALQPLGIAVVLPDEYTILFKEALVMALLGALRWREENTVLASVTGALRDSIGGALWMGGS